MNNEAEVLHGWIGSDDEVAAEPVIEERAGRIEMMVVWGVLPIACWCAGWLLWTEVVWPALLYAVEVLP